MRIPRYFAWLLVVLGLFTAGLLRQFHEGTPRSPYFPAAVGSLLFLGIFFLLLVSAREWRAGAVPGPGVRLGSLTPLLLMLLMEKWLSLSLYVPVFYAITPVGLPDVEYDAMYRAFAGAGLLLLCVLFASFSRPTGRKVRDRSRPSRWPVAALVTLVAASGSIGLLWLLSRAAGAEFHLVLPVADRLWWWVILGQALLAFAEEVYYRGILMSEIERLCPRLGIRGKRARRWVALVATSTLFGVEHLAFSAPWHEMGRQLIFSVALGLLLGMLVQITSNLHLAGGMHAWINWLMLGVVPLLTDGSDGHVFAPGTYIGVSLILAFCLALVVHRRQRRG